MSRLQEYLQAHGITLEDANMAKNETFSKLREGIRTYDDSVVELKSFVNWDGFESHIKDLNRERVGEGKEVLTQEEINLEKEDWPNYGTIKYFWYKNPDQFTYNKQVRKPSSRSQMFQNREEFKVEPWFSITVDDAVKYGSKVDFNVEEYFNEGAMESMMEETAMSIRNMKVNRLVWVDRSMMICHPQGYSYGEVDELLYSPEIDTYFVGDTKTSSNVYKAGYAYQLAMYIEILKLLNPDKKFAPLGLINWVKIKKEKWVMDRTFNELEWEGVVVPEGKLKDHPIYTAKFKGKMAINPEYTSTLVSFDVDAVQMSNMVRAEWYLIYEILPKYNYFAHASTLPIACAENEKIREANEKLQARFMTIKEDIEKLNKGITQHSDSNNVLVDLVAFTGEKHEK